PSGPSAPDPELSQRNVRLGAVVLVVLLGVVGLNLLRHRGGGGPSAVSGEVRSSLERAGCRLDDRSDPGRTHIPNATYTVDPPSGGDHDPVPAPAGFYDTTDVPTDGHLVHSLEHGFVIVWYQPASTPEPTLTALRILARKHRWVLVAPRSSMPAALAATAWHRRLLCPQGTGTDAAIGNFVTAFRNQGPEKGFV
ncbi:MAG TPA: DUF3105 domain-containing protein, partial [Gemmatimonadales bacterium]|nr:DUF3105 domain-containing protein [Gemmatimonadales bacterium]